VSEDFRGLEEISIRNLGVIESAEIHFKPGLNVLTGETGAGKTMVLSALALILGGKSDSEKVRTGAERLIATGRFAISPQISAPLEEFGVQLEEGSLLISRTITSDGKSRINLGGLPTTSGRVSELASELVEVHAQSTTNRLTKPAFVRKALDTFGGHHALLEKVSSNYQRYNEISERILQLQRDQQNRDLELTRLTEFMRAFSAVTPVPGEPAQIEVELTRLNSVDELQQGVSAALNYSDAEDFSVLAALVNAKRALEHLAGKDNALDLVAEELGDCLYKVEEVIGSLHRYLVALDADPIRLEYLQERKSAINSLIKRFGEGGDLEVAYDQLIFRALESGTRIADLEGGGTRIADLELELREIFSRLVSDSEELSQLRQSAARILQEKISQEVRSLAMAHSAVTIEVSTHPGKSIDDFNSFGLDEISLLFTSHEGAAPGAINKVASGGELSRVMLAIEVVLATLNPVSTYIFDEVDAGVGGRAAIEVGRRLKLLAKSSQVIVVTHLAQVAVWADNHLVVRKSEGGLVSASDVTSLTVEERSVEIARMLSGQEDSATARQHAKELLELVGKSVIS